MRKFLMLGTGTAALALALVLSPVVPDLAEGDLAGAVALANGNGAGNGGGNGNGNGNGGGRGGKGGGPGATAGIGKGLDKTDKADRTDKGRTDRTDKASSGRALGHGRDAVSGVGLGKDKARDKARDKTDTETATQHGLTAASLGRLNAAHASPTAMANAAPHSAVGLIGQFSEAERAAIEAAINGDEAALDEAVEAAARSLAAAANKDIDDDVVSAVNDLLGIDVEGDLAEAGVTDPPDIEGDIADAAQDAQASETNQGLGGFKDSPDDDGDGAEADDGEDVAELE